MNTVLQMIYDNYTGQDRELLIRAYRYAEEAHSGQKRASGEAYFIHPCAVAQILIELGLDSATVAAAFLHDVIEDTPVTEEDIRRDFGDEILRLVSGVTKLDKIVFKSREEEEAENFRKIFVAMAKDIRVIIIKLADRLHNMRSLNFLSKERQVKMAQETLDIYTPLAGRLGISQIKCELEDLCLKYLEPEAYEYLVENIHQKLYERHNFVDFVVKEIKNILEESKIQGEVFGRPKHFYSIYKKMKTQNKTLDQIYDLTAVRVIVNTVDECYEVFGKIHKRWKPIPGRIKDYIATPKANMYQSLHTTVVTNFGQPFEIQIRTFEMHRTAEFGIAAHWKYKEKKAEDTSFTERLSWIREVLDWEGGLKDSKEFVQSLKTELYSNELLVFTPKGKVISLPKDATPIDFAYAIHSEVGNRCTGARVNSKIVPLNSTLQTGDVVEILTSANSKGPSWDWLKIVKSSSARAKIKQFFRREMKEENVKLGKSMLESEAKRRGYSLSDILTEESFAKVSEKFSFSSQDEMFASVGYGAITVNQVLFKLIDFYKKEIPKPAIYRGETTGDSSGVIVKGMSGLLTRFAGCCNPVPGDEIVGFVSRGRGVVIHRADCPNIKNLETEEGRILPAEWAAGGSGRFVAGIVIKAKDQGVALSVLTSVVSDMRLMITGVNSRFDKNKDAVIEANIRLNGREDIDLLIKKIRSDERIDEVFRTATK
ncbi:MAG TPA: bifunctional (p)ppGpp synthetase/guanosine-3',5'-bis(diphosphate) 3'-pyrophosphohydrolase [Candidatus Borkfalkia excrementigallinarum]|uniref:GTP diphosphokinase n=1 Tax=Candidatus Borkfalkia excrementigallinarum TaxID=2838506 RepID=A0A9D2CS85_9FIRM|nr:bifunctional (p)ppGpp synthetase/guanosine-3',5'-bis(diphosphate) 3'-pyrophosphohydrolase [Candidatus Borkfalkia excrementigallinarum]